MAQGQSLILLQLRWISSWVYSIHAGHTEHLATGFDGTESNPGRIAIGLYNGMWAYDGWSELLGSHKLLFLSEDIICNILCLSLKEHTQLCHWRTDKPQWVSILALLKCLRTCLWKLPTAGTYACRNLPRSILIGMPVVVILYLLVNISYFSVMSVAEVLESPAVALVSILQPSQGELNLYYSESATFATADLGRACDSWCCMDYASVCGSVNFWSS